MRSIQTLCPQMANPVTRLVAANGSIVERDEEQAEIYVRGPLVMQGYLGNSEATRAIIDAEGWMKTGDVGYTDGGKYYIVDRVKVGQSLRFGLYPINARQCPIAADRTVTGDDQGPWLAGLPSRTPGRPYAAP